MAKIPPKFSQGEKVRIIGSKNQHGHLKYHDFRNYVDETGQIINSNWVSLGIISETEQRDFYIYEVSLDKTGNLIKIPEEALEVTDL